MAMDWRNLPAVIASPKQNTPSLETIPSSESTSNPDPPLDDNEEQHIMHDIVIDDDDTQSSSDSNDDHHYEEDDSLFFNEEHETKQNELRRNIRRAKHLAKIREVYADYLSESSTTTNSTDSTTNHLQTVPYRAPRRTRGCPHWIIGCKFEGDEAAVTNHINDCCFEKMKAMIKKRDHQISSLQNSCNQLQHQVHQLHSLFSSFISLQTPQLQSYLMSHLPNDINSNQEALSLDRNISSELYDAPHNGVKLSLHSLDDTTRPLAYQRREVNRESIHKHEISIGGSLGLIWRSMETIIGYDNIDNGNSSLLNPSVNYINKLALSPQNSGNLSGNKGKKDIAIQSMLLFWNVVISSSNLGIQIWDILHDDNDAEIEGLSHNGWLFNEASFGLATQPFSHPYWLFTGHKQEIRAWKYNGFSFNTLCNCSACGLVFPSQGFGDVRCIAVSCDHIFASSDSNIIQFWKLTESNDDGSHCFGATTLDKRINAVGNIDYLGNLVCGHRGMITSLKVFGDVLISGSKDGFITIWSATELVNLSILHYGSNPVLDFTIFPNPYPLCHITIWNEHLNALKSQNNIDNNCDHKHEIKSMIQYVSLNSLYDEIPKKEQNTIQDTIMGFIEHDIDTKQDIEQDTEVRVLSKQIMHNASSHFASIALIIKDLKLIVGGRSGEIHIWHIGNSETTTWERETTLRGHGDIVTQIASFGTHLLSAYSNGSIKLWKWDKSHFLCRATAYTDPSKRIGSADTKYCEKEYNSVRSVLMLPSPALNLNRNDDNFDEHENDEDEMELKSNEWNVKISANHDDKRRHRINKNKMESYYDKEFWVLSGTSNGSMLLHNNIEYNEYL